MKVVWGAVTPQYDGKADDGDPTTPAGAYSGPVAPGACNDGAARASSAGAGVLRAPPGANLAGAAQAAVGAGSKTLGNAQSMNKLDQQFSVAQTFLERLLARVGWGPKFSITLDLDTSCDFKVGTASVSTQGVIFSPGVSHGIGHSYAITMNADMTKIDITRDGKRWKTLAAKGAFPAEHDVMAPVQLKDGTYTFRSELNIMDTADGHVTIDSGLTARLVY
jgi:hypothetical protein